jgi:hypothetical protein
MLYYAILYCMYVSGDMAGMVINSEHLQHRISQEISHYYFSNFTLFLTIQCSVCPKDCRAKRMPILTYDVEKNSFFSSRKYSCTVTLCMYACMHMYVCSLVCTLICMCASGEPCTIPVCCSTCQPDLLHQRLSYKRWKKLQNKFRLQLDYY